MKPHEITALYDESYADIYDARFMRGRAREFEVKLIRERLGSSGTYLDVGCGTGWFLSQFPDRERTGIDLSPSMLVRARAANPGVTIREGSFLSEQPDWEGRWDVVSCMWFAYCYLETVDEVDALIANMARWTRPGGTNLLPICIVDADLGYRRPMPVFGGDQLVTGVTWSWTDPADSKHHRHLIAPHPEHLLGQFAQHFRRVELFAYPRQDAEAPVHAIVASGRRTPADDEEATVLRLEDPATALRGRPPSRRAAGTLGRRALLRILRAAERRLALDSADRR